MKKKLKPWYETHPRELWTAEDYEYARKEGWRPKSDTLYEPLGKYPATPSPKHTLQSWHASQRKVDAEHRSKRVDAILDRLRGRR